MFQKPLAIDLFCGLGGWAEGFLAEGYDVIGFDVERHDYGTGGYPGQLVIQDVLTLDGAQFRDAAVIVASPPCQAYSYRAMPWKRAKALPPPSNELFEACFRIQREASAAAGHYIPLVVENVKGAQPWVGRAAWHYGPYYLWGDVPALMPVTRAAKVPGLNWSGSDRPDYVARAFNDTAVARLTKQHGSGAAWFDKALDERRRQATAAKNGTDWFGSGKDYSLQRRANSRKAASAQIAKIPFELARHIAAVYKPSAVSAPASTPDPTSRALDSSAGQSSATVSSALSRAAA